MNINVLVGKWLLIGSVWLNSEIEFVGEEPDPNGVTNWLNGKSYELIEQIKSTKGLTLTITTDGRFKEVKTGEPEVRWFDSEGVESEVTPFDGKLSLSESNIYLIADEQPSWGTPMDEENRIKLRYDDGDTKITDSIEIIDEHLIRTVNVVTDELYLDRVVIVYQREK